MTNIEKLPLIKPGETEIMFADRINTAEDLQIALAKVEMLTNQDLNQINVEEMDWNNQPNNRYMIKLERECLTDGSIVYNVLLGYAPIQQEGN